MAGHEPPLDAIIASKIVRASVSVNPAAWSEMYISCSCTADAVSVLRGSSAILIDLRPLSGVELIDQDVDPLG